jgi:hypothetical protein
MLERLSSNRTFQALLVAAILILGAVYWLSPDRRFDRARWLAADLESSARADMVDDLLRRYRLAGWTQRQVLNLLGPPTPTDKWEDWELIYVLGPQSGLLRVDHEWLLIDVRGDRVVGYQVTHD